jgi:acetoin utilization protein AcuB
MSPAPTIGSVMTKFPYSIECGVHASTARSMLTQLKIRHLPVTEGDRIVGAVTDRDLKQAEALGLDLAVTGDIRVADVCNRDIYLVGPDESLEQVLTHMADNHIDVTFVVEQGKLAGLFTVTDVCRHYAELLRRKKT